MSLESYSYVFKHPCVLCCEVVCPDIRYKIWAKYLKQIRTHHRCRCWFFTLLWEELVDVSIFYEKSSSYPSIFSSLHKRNLLKEVYTLPSPTTSWTNISLMLKWHWIQMARSSNLWNHSFLPHSWFISFGFCATILTWISSYSSFSIFLHVSFSFNCCTFSVIHPSSLLF